MVKLTLEWSDFHYHTVSNVEIFAPRCAGVYKLFYFVANRSQLFYIGQTENLRKELLNHLSDTEPNVCIRRHFGYYACYFQFPCVTSQLEREGAERSLYDHYRPSCNTVPPQREPCDINFN